MFDNRSNLAPHDELLAERYAAPMAASAEVVATALRERLPGLPLKKLHKLLYYCQGHHLAATGEPIFSDTVSAWDMGPVVGRLWHRERTVGPTPPVQLTLDESQLNTVGYVVSRYGALTGRDLENLTHAEDPWRRANHDRQPETSTRIEQEWMRDYFTSDREEADLVLDSDTVAGWLHGALQRRDDIVRPDDYEVLRRRAHAS